MFDVPGLSDAWQSVMHWWNDPFWYWVNWYLTIIVPLALLHWLLPAARSLTGPIILVLTFGLYAYWRGGRDANARNKVRQRPPKPHQDQWSWWR